VSELFGVSIIITNKPAGSGAAGIEAVVKAKPDGYTILGGADTALTLIPLMNPEVSFRYTSLLPIAWSAYGPNVILVRPDSPFKTLQEVIDFAKKNPGKLTHGSSGIGHMTNISMQLIKKAAGVEIVHLPYQGGGPLRSAILGGHVDLTCDTIVGVPALVKTGAVRALAICADKRSEELPQVPTVAELGYPNASLPVWVGYLAPLATPQQIIDKWNLVVKRALADPGVMSSLMKVPVTVEYKPPEVMAKSLERVNSILSEWIKEGGLTKK
jgi:tripartite-type tricarboxylate transporter receptor subunit TctC